jgi:hypothetical protein
MSSREKVIMAKMPGNTLDSRRLPVEVVIIVSPTIVQIRHDDGGIEQTDA